MTPLGAHEQGNFQKSTVVYTNTVGYANRDGNLIVKESMLITPAYRIFLLLDEEKEIELELLQRIKKGEAVYIPYFGKNEFAVWWDVQSVQQHVYEEYRPKESFVISSVFVKNKLAAAAQQKQLSFSESVFGPERYAYFERLPIGFNEKLRQYEMADFAFTNWTMVAETDIEGLYRIEGEDLQIIQLF